jgi:hypothetical protein
MKKIILFLILSLSIFSCKKTDVTEGNSLVFYPRNVNNAYIIPGKVINTDNNGVIYKDIRDIEPNSSIKYNELSLALLTSNFDISGQYERGFPGVNFFDRTTNINTHNSGIELQINLSYKKSYPKSVTKANSEANDIIRMEYRLNGIKNIKISSLNTTLFGQSPGQSLNDYFFIGKYIPQIIISSTNLNLLYGFKSKTLPTSIDEWLALSPMAQPAMYLELKSAPPELPQTVQFTVEMETDTGAKLSYTSFPVTLTK